MHPGYGFLSENADFREALDKRGIAFIGPGSRAITSMGDKITSKKLAAEAGVNTIPGYTGVIDGRRSCGQDRPRNRLPGDAEGQRRRRRQGHARGLQ